jgi:cytochrome P450
MTSEPVTDTQGLYHDEVGYQMLAFPGWWPRGMTGNGFGGRDGPAGVTLLISGRETTANQIGDFVSVLLDHDRAGWRQLVAQPDLVPTAVEELPRFVPMAASADFARVARGDIAVGGQLVRAGEAVLVQLHAANRDHAVFDDPDVLDLARARNPHVAFGHGPHHCLGAPLARMELQIALAGPLTRMPSLRLAVPAEEVPWRADRLVRGVDSLPVTW